MKKFFLVTGILIVAATSASYAQYTVDDDNVKEVKSINTETPGKIQKEENQDAVSVFTRNQFASDFPDATNVRFEKTKDLDEVTYREKGRKLTSYYDYNGELVGTIRNRSFRDLPAIAQTKIADKYPNYTVVKVLRYQVNTDNELYIDNNSPDIDLDGNSFENDSNYFVELKNDNNAIVLMVGLSGEVSFFTTIK